MEVGYQLGACGISASLLKFLLLGALPYHYSVMQHVLVLSFAISYSFASW